VFHDLFQNQGLHCTCLNIFKNNISLNIQGGFDNLDNKILSFYYKLISKGMKLQIICPQAHFS